MKKTVISCLVGLLCVSAIVIVVLRHDGASSKADIDPGDRDEVSSRNPGKKFSVTPASSQRKRHKVANLFQQGFNEIIVSAASTFKPTTHHIFIHMHYFVIRNSDTTFLAHADEDVRDSAMNEWTTALSSIEDEKAKIGVVELAMGVLKDEDALESISSEYIGVDEKLAVESLSRIITDGKSAAGVEKAKETYEFVTGDEWAGVDEAARWIAEEYEPPNQADASGGNQR